MTKSLSPAAHDHVFGIITTGPFASHVGMSVEEAEVDRVVIRMRGADHIMNGVGIAHGGALATLIDTAATAAAWASSDVKPTTRGTTVALTINFLSGAPQSDLLAEGRVLSRGGTLTIIDVTARTADGNQTIAKAQVTYKLDLARDRRLERP
ncbi:MAG: PaaI family thioesterase [Pseudomonadota bacterium]